MGDKKRSSAIPEFRTSSRSRRLEIISDMTNLNDADIIALQSENGGVSFEHANNMIENTIGLFCTPLGVATNFVVNGKDVLVPMAIEEPSVVAAASKGAKAARHMGGFTASMSSSYNIGQIQLLDVRDIGSAADKILAAGQEIISLANTQSKTLPQKGCGAKTVSCRTVDTPSNGAVLIVELLVDVADAMGANVTNSMCEAVAPLLEKICNSGSKGGARALLRILSNYSTRRIAVSKATFSKDAVGGEKVVNDMISAFEFADCDIYRAVTHNKGAMNGIIAVATATGQDSRAIEAGAHAYASQTGRYRSITRWSKDANGNLRGEIRLPLSVGIVGGVISTHPVAKICVGMLGVKSAAELACIMASAGLAQNYAAMRALVTDGIQKGHMRLHARNFAVAAGAKPDEIDDVVQKMVSKSAISLQGAKDALHMRSSS